MWNVGLLVHINDDDDDDDDGVYMGHKYNLLLLLVA